MDFDIEDTDCYTFYSLDWTISKESSYKDPSSRSVLRSQFQRILQLFGRERHYTDLYWHWLSRVPGFEWTSQSNPGEWIQCITNSTAPRAWSVIADKCVSQYNDTIHSSTKFASSYFCRVTEKGRICTAADQENGEENRIFCLLKGIFDWNCTKILEFQQETRL